MNTRESCVYLNTNLKSLAFIYIDQRIAFRPPEIYLRHFMPSVLITALCFHVWATRDFMIYNRISWWLPHTYSHNYFIAVWWSVLVYLDVNFSKLHVYHFMFLLQNFQIIYFLQRFCWYSSNLLQHEITLNRNELIWSAPYNPNVAQFEVISRKRFDELMMKILRDLNCLVGKI